LDISGQQQLVSTAGREKWDGAAVFQVGQGPLPRGWLPPDVPMHIFAAVTHLDDFM